MNSALTSAWLEAAEELKLRIEAPFSLTNDDGESVEFEVLILDFGAPNGTLVTAAGTEDNLEIASSADFLASQLDPGAYGKYDAELFKSTLNDWGWTGSPESEPEWYTGESW